MILVDQLTNYPGQGQWCHLMSDLPGQEGLDELHAFARSLNLSRSWYQAQPTHPHYDLRPGPRTTALSLGAQAVTGIELIRRCVRNPNGTLKYIKVTE